MLSSSFIYSQCAYFDSGQYNCSVSMSQTWSDPFADALRFAVIFGRVIRQRIQNKNLTPFRALIERRQQFVDGLCVHFHQRLATRTSFINLGQRSYCICNDLKQLSTYYRIR